MHLDPSAAALGFRLIVLDAVDSTNSAGLALARAGDPGNVWIAARQQSAGRGRRGRAWHSPLGNLYASLLLTDPCAPERAPQLSFVAALALRDAVSALAPTLGARLRLKWPNDLLLDGAKLAGILVEGETLADNRFAAVIGIGVNCAAHPPETPYPATDLAAADIEARPDELFCLLSHTMRLRLAQWAAGANFAGIRTDWLAAAARVGEPVFLPTTNDIEGVFAGVDEYGRLLLRGATGVIEAFAAADVHPLLKGKGRGEATGKDPSVSLDASPIPTRPATLALLSGSGKEEPA